MFNICYLSSEIVPALYLRYFVLCILCIQESPSSRGFRNHGNPVFPGYYSVLACVQKEKGADK